MMLCFIVTSSFLAGLPVPQLVAILNVATPPPEYPVNYLTSLERDKWALAKAQLVTDQYSGQDRLHPLCDVSG